jgi:hypothetical protein
MLWAQKTVRKRWNGRNARRAPKFVAGSGDGSGTVSCDGSSFITAVGTPASDPFVLGLGGTDLRANLKTGKYESETVWNEPAYAGGFSNVYSRPDYQAGLSSSACTASPPTDTCYQSDNDIAGLTVNAVSIDDSLTPGPGLRRSRRRVGSCRRRRLAHVQRRPSVPIQPRPRARGRIRFLPYKRDRGGKVSATHTLIYVSRFDFHATVIIYPHGLATNHRGLLLCRLLEGAIATYPYRAPTSGSAA